jgi:transcriptional regulator with XRE-family HTH domain
MRGRALSNPGPLGIQPAFHFLRRRGIGLTVLAENLCVSVGHVSGVMSGRTVPTRQVVAGTERFLGLPADDLFTPALLAAVASRSETRRP